MIHLDIRGDFKSALTLFSPKVIEKAAQRSISRTLDSTRAYASKLAESKFKIKSKAIRSAITLSKPKAGSKVLSGDMKAKGGERLPLTGFPTRTKIIRKVPKNYIRKKTLRSYPLISVKLWGRDRFTPIPGAFKVKLRGGNSKVPTAQRTGRTKLALLKRVTEKRYKTRQLLTNQPDVAGFLIEQEDALTLHASERMTKEFTANLKFYQGKQKQ